MSKTTGKPLCAVVGVGPGNGAAFARRFAAEGYQVALLARTVDFTQKLAREVPDSAAYGCDVSEASSIARAFAEIREKQGDVDVVIYNAGSGTWGTVDDVGGAEFEAAWRV